jgi:hypothetical protein
MTKEVSHLLTWLAVKNIQVFNGGAYVRLLLYNLTPYYKPTKA